jgi:hypothetical protein
MPTVTDLVNQALDLAGYPKPVADLYEGSTAAKVALRHFGQTRDDLLRSHYWDFARRTVVLSVIKAATNPPSGVWNETQPPPPWGFSYAWPCDCIQLRYVQSSPAQIGDALNPQPNLFTIGSDFPTTTSTTASKVILCNIQSALATYTAQVTDPNQWEPGFTEAMVSALAKKFTVELAKEIQILSQREKDSDAAEAMAQTRDL